MQKNISIFIIILLICSGGAFYAGTKYSAGKNSSASTVAGNSTGGARGAGQGFGGGGGGNRRQGGGFVNGEIIKKDDTSITIQLPNRGTSTPAIGNANAIGTDSASIGGTKIIYISGKTTIGKTVDGTKDDLEIGKNVMVSGSPSADGSIVAQSVQIRTANPMGQDNSTNREGSRNATTTEKTQ
ncbi:MAG: hypothetical protein NT091_01180 [Candidatus Falkowbacteria bacterium]|nr:hypothetical protein [Candidatus Falkowbacteria bacterium]